MGTQLAGMYDEFRVKSFKAKIMLVLGENSGQYQLHSAFDRNGKLAEFIYSHNEDGTMIPFRESQSSIMTYSSLQTKQIVQYQSGTILR